MRHALGAHKKFAGKENNGMTTTCVTFLLHVLQADFGCAAVFNTSNEAYPWPSIVLRHRPLASFAESC